VISEHASVQALVVSAVAMRILLVVVLDLRGSNWEHVVAENRVSLSTYGSKVNTL
jgi:hypothetical protein